MTKQTTVVVIGILRVNSGILLHFKMLSVNILSGAFFKVKFNEKQKLHNSRKGLC